MATFLKDQLDECVDVAAVPKPGEEAWVSGFGKKLADSQPGAVLLPQPCGEQFPNRIVLATCESMAAAPKGTVKTFIRYYNVSTVIDSDGFMKECLQRGGSWKANADAEAVRHAQREHLRKQVVKLAQ